MDRKSEYKPNPSAQWVKQTLAEDDAALERAAGRLPDSRAIEDRVSAQLRGFDARAPERDRRAAYKSAQQLTQRQRTAWNNIGTRYRLGKGIQLKKAKISRHPAECTCADCKLRDRIRHLIELYPGTVFRQSDFMFPRWAKLIAQEFTDHKRSKGKYAGYPQAECELILKRALEDIADKSTGVLGEWR